MAAINSSNITLGEAMIAGALFSAVSSVIATSVLLASQRKEHIATDARLTALESSIDAIPQRSITSARHAGLASAHPVQAGSVSHY